MAQNFVIASSGRLVPSVSKALLCAAILGVTVGTPLFSGAVESLQSVVQTEAPAVVENEQADASGAVAGGWRRLPSAVVASAFVASLVLMFLSLLSYRKLGKLEEMLQQARRYSEVVPLMHDETGVRTGARGGLIVDGEELLQDDEEDNDKKEIDKRRQTLVELLKQLPQEEETDEPGTSPAYLLDKMMKRYSGSNYDLLLEEEKLSPAMQCQIGLASLTRAETLYLKINEKVKAIRGTEEERELSLLLLQGMTQDAAEKILEEKRKRLAEEIKVLIHDKDLSLQLAVDVELEVKDFVSKQ